VIVLIASFSTLAFLNPAFPFIAQQAPIRRETHPVSLAVNTDDNIVINDKEL
jgi:hypothetical protein